VRNRRNPSQHRCKFIKTDTIPDESRLTMTKIERHLTDAERNVMYQLAVEVVARQTGRGRESVADELDEMDLQLHGDATNAYLDADGVTLVHISREDLALAANHPGETLQAVPLDDRNEQ